MHISYNKNLKLWWSYVKLPSIVTDNVDTCYSELTIDTPLTNITEQFNYIGFCIIILIRLVSSINNSTLYNAFIIESGLTTL